MNSGLYVLLGDLVIVSVVVCVRLLFGLIMKFLKVYLGFSVLWLLLGVFGGGVGVVLVLGVGVVVLGVGGGLLGSSRVFCVVGSI